MGKKFELTAEKKEICGRTLFRIKALMSFGNVREGELGGWVEKEENLSQNGEAWVYNEACVYNEARVFDEARVYGKARVYSEAQVFDEARIFGEARVCGEARIFGEAQVSDEARIFGEARVFGEAQVSGEARIFGEAQVSDKARVFDEARIFGKAQVCGEAQVSGAVLYIIGLDWNVTITDKHIKIGCQMHPISFWEKASTEIIAKMETGALEFWGKYKNAILGLANSRV